MKIYHLVEPPDWAAALAAGSHEPASLQGEGFIHFSFREQLLESANRHYGGAEALFAVVYEDESFGEALVVEDTSGRGKFPHVYRALAPGDAVEIVTLKKGPQGWEAPAI